MKVTNNTPNTSNTKPIYPNPDQSQIQDSTKKRKPNPHLGAVAGMPAEATLRLRGGGADAKRKEARKRKFAQTEPRASSTTNPAQQSESAGISKTDPNVSKQPTKKRKRTQAKDPSATNNNNVDSKAAPTSPEADDTEAAVDGAVPDAETVEAKPQRFIVFIGNLPFTATTDSIRTHFAKVAPTSVRHSMHKGTGTSKGFAFLEFAGYDRMKTCLKLYHHSSFEDGVSAARKINVELTAGGGGAKSKERREKLQTKNEKLNEERKRRAVEEEKANRKAGKEVGKAAGAGAGAGVDDAGDVHPSRRARVPKG